MASNSHYSRIPKLRLCTQWKSGSGKLSISFLSSALKCWYIIVSFSGSPASEHKYGKVGRARHLFSHEHDVIGEGLEHKDNVLHIFQFWCVWHQGFNKLLMVFALCLAMYVQLVACYLWVFCCSEPPGYAHARLNPFYHCSTFGITHTRLSPPSQFQCLRSKVGEDGNEARHIVLVIEDLHSTLCANNLLATRMLIWQP